MLPIPTSLRQRLSDAKDLGSRCLHDEIRSIRLEDVLTGTGLDADPHLLAGRNVLLLTDRQAAAGLALIELDGVARRIVVCPPDLNPARIGDLVEDAECDVVVTDSQPVPRSGIALQVRCGLDLRPTGPRAFGELETEWIMLTSGTAGRPKMVAHSLQGLTGSIPRSPSATQDRPPVWGTFYDIRRYGGLQIFLRALFGTGSLVLSSPGEDVVVHLNRLARHGVTHQSGTPSHWRKVLMSACTGVIDPDYVRLSGEIADQAVLDNLRRAYPRAAIGHAYASTEAGVAFEVTDGLEGFPSDLVGQDGRLAMRVEDGSLRIRSDRAARRYVGPSAPELMDRDGFIDTDDMVEFRGDRYYFVGRRSGVINVGGLKVHPEEVEAVINRHDRVRVSLVRGRTNPITGSIIVADVVLDAGSGGPVMEDAALKSDILALCRRELPQHKVPVLLRFLPRLDFTPAGKLARPHA